MTLKEMREKQAKLVTDARSALDEITANTDESRSKELEDRHDKIMEEYDQIGADIKREERTATIETAAAERRAAQRPNGNDGEARGDGEDGSAAEQMEMRTAQYRSAFAKIVCGVPTDELEPEERQILRSGVKKFEQRIQTAGAPTAGGYAVPITLMAEIVRVMKDWGPMFDTDVARVLSTASGNEMTLPTVDDTGVEPEPHGEGSDLTDDGGKDVTLGQKVLNAFSFDTEFIKWSWELEQDSIFDMEMLLADLLGERLGRLGNKQLTVGTGAGAPHGIVTASALGKTAALAAAIAPDEIVEFQHSVNAAYRRSPKCRWQFADSTLLAIRKMKDGEGNYLWQMGDIKVGEPDRLLGKPYSINDDVPAIGAGTKPIIFGDHSKYFVRKIGSPIIGVLRERFWPNMGIAGLSRFDGELADTNAVKHMVMAP